MSTEETPLQLLEQDLAGKRALVTGASRGIGRAIALHLALRGASVIGTCSASSSLHHITRLGETVTQAYAAAQPHTPAPRIVGLPANLLSADTPATVLEAVKREFNGKLDILVNNAAYDEMRGVGELDAEYVGRSLLGNVQTLVLTVDGLIREERFAREARVVNVSAELSRGAHLPHHSFGLFAATKAAMESLTRTWADVLGSHPAMGGTTVNALLAGATDTEAFCKMFPPEQKEAVVERVSEATSIKRLGMPQDMADIVGLLVSKRAGWITGSVVNGNGGSVKVL